MLKKSPPITIQPGPESQGGLEVIHALHPYTSRNTLGTALAMTMAASIMFPSWALCLLARIRESRSSTQAQEAIPIESTTNDEAAQSHLESDGIITTTHVIYPLPKASTKCATRCGTATQA